MSLIVSIWPQPHKTPEILVRLPLVFSHRKMQSKDRQVPARFFFRMPDTYRSRCCTGRGHTGRGKVHRTTVLGRAKALQNDTNKRLRDTTLRCGDWNTETWLPRGNGAWHHGILHMMTLTQNGNCWR